jgi:hypothetical protein
MRPHPLFASFIGAARAYADQVSGRTSRAVQELIEASK